MVPKWSQLVNDNMTFIFCWNLNLCSLLLRDIISSVFICNDCINVVLQWNKTSREQDTVRCCLTGWNICSSYSLPLPQNETKWFKIPDVWLKNKLAGVNTSADPKWSSVLVESGRWHSFCVIHFSSQPQLLAPVFSHIFMYHAIIL